MGALIAPAAKSSRGKALLTLAVVANLALLGYFKYANFFASVVNDVTGSHWGIAQLILPLGISFFTFEQITYLIDAYRGETSTYDLLDFGVFVSFFPRLIAGPIVRHYEILPQFHKHDFRFRHENVTAGLVIFLAGLAEKVLIADTAAQFVPAVFAHAAKGGTPTFSEAWTAVLAYTVQLYFDFAGYSNMALGLARMFGIRLPVNFNSPYKATSVVDFWRRWHITLSRFLRDYLYIGLGGNRCSPTRRYVNLFLTMVIGGLWHGAGWTFLGWGALHGIYLMINHGWRAILRAAKLDIPASNRPVRFASQLLTLVAVVVGWVFFRATNWNAATIILGSMFGARGISLPPALESRLAPLTHFGVNFQGLGNLINVPEGLAITLVFLAIAMFAPNTQQWLAITQPTLEPVEKPARFLWKPTPLWSVLFGVVLFLVVRTFFRSAPSEFLYFNF
jgi:D-alanyl-lipoteichoic acid acyltransferase DltB (MBOAT superfamily)